MSAAGAGARHAARGGASLPAAVLGMVGALAWLPAARAEQGQPDGPPPAAFDVFPRMLVQTDTVVAHHGANAPAIEDGTTRPGFYLRRVRVGLDAADGDWRARAIVEATARSEVADAALDPIAGEIDRGRTRPTEAYVAFAPHKAFVLSAGSLRVPLGLSRQVDEADLRLPERARIITRATPDFRMGATASGDLGLLQYALGAFVVAPTFGADFRNGGVLDVLRLAAEPVGPLGVAPQLRRHDDPWYRWWRFSAGLSAFYATLPGANEFGLGGDGQFQWARLLVTGEILWTRQAGADRVGFTVEPGVFVVRDRLELVARAEWLNDEVGPTSPVDAWGGALGATFYAPSRHVRLQAAYTLRRAAVGSASDPTGGGRTAGWAVLRATFTL